MPLMDRPVHGHHAALVPRVLTALPLCLLSRAASAYTGHSIVYMPPASRGLKPEPM